jgi:hypothetical protein
MELNGKRLFIQFYGLGHLILGAALFVGLSSGYFLKEAILIYPSAVVSFLFEPDLLALTSLAVFLGAIFHLVAGVLTARLNDWIRYWFYFGWPVMVIIKFGLAYSYYENWVQHGYIDSISDILSWPKIILLFGLIAFDVIFIAGQISEMNISLKESLEEERLSFGKIFVVLFIAVLTLCLVLYLGKPIKKGFHKGFYKTKGEYSPTQMKPIDVKVKEQVEEAPVPLATQPAQEAQEEINTPTQKLSVPEVKEEEKGISIIAPDKKISESVQKEGVAYIQILGWLGAVSLVIGFIFYFLNNVQIYFTLLAFGFFCWTVYAIALNLWPITLAGVCVILLTGLYFVNKTSS